MGNPFDKAPAAETVVAPAVTAPVPVVEPVVNVADAPAPVVKEEPAAVAPAGDGTLLGDEPKAPQTADDEAGLLLVAGKIAEVKHKKLVHIIHGK